MRIKMKMPSPGMETLGPRIRVRLTNPDVPSNSKVYDAEIDTGTCFVGVDPRVAKELGLKGMGSVEAHTTGGEEIVEQQLTKAIVQLTADKEEIDLGVHPCLIHSVNPFDQIQILIGRNVLSQFIFVYDGPNDTYVLDHKPPGEIPKTE